MKFGVLVFSYSSFSGLANFFKHNRHISVNIGDYMQTLAVRDFYRKVGIPPGEVVAVDRDTLPSYDGEPITLIMNGCFFHHCFPIPPQITPVFVGFQALEPVIIDFLDFFKLHQPIGCRDTATEQLFHKHGVKAYTTGCMTMSFDRRTTVPEQERVLLVYGTGSGVFPPDALGMIPDDILKKLEIIFHRKIVHSFPMITKDMQDVESYARYLLGYYRLRASHVITPLHHVATPCMSSGIKVSIVRNSDDSRFSFLRSLIPVYTAPDFSGIDWRPVLADIDTAKAMLIDATKRCLDAASRSG